MHRTRQKLIDTVVELIDDEGEDRIVVERVIQVSGVSKGSMYHHFEDFDDLVDAALVQRFSANVDDNIAFAESLYSRATTAQEILEGLREMTAMTQSPALAAKRLERVGAVGRAARSERFRTALGQEQQRLTDAFADLLRRGQERGWINPDLDPLACAVFIQAYTLGRVIDDISPTKVEPAAWNDLIDLVVSRVLA